MPVDSLSKYIPNDMVEPLKRCSQYIKRTDTIILKSDEHSKPKANAHQCLAKLNDLLEGIAQEVVAKEALAAGPPGLNERLL